MYMLFTAEAAEFTEETLKNLCELGALCGKFPYQHSTGILSHMAVGYYLL
jgi:hypothetical protein